MRLKRLELWWRRLWIRVLVRLMRRSDTGGRPDWSARPHRVLFLRHDRAGDMIVSTGVMRAIAASHPTIQLDVLASPVNAAILSSAPYVHDVIVFNKKQRQSYIETIRRLRAAHYDAVVDCMVTAPSLTTLLLILASGARYRVGIAGRGNDAAFNITVPANTMPHAHMVDLLAALAQAFDVDLASVSRRPAIHLTDDEVARGDAVWGAPNGAPRVLVNTSAGTSERAWVVERYVNVMHRIHSRAPNAVLRVISAPNEAERATRIAELGGGAFVKTPSIRDAFALVATADMLVTPDTSIGHAASAFGTPCVVMFTRGKGEQWGLYQTPGTTIEHPDETLDTLSDDVVLAAVDDLLDRGLERPVIGDASLGKSR